MTHKDRNRLALQVLLICMIIGSSGTVVLTMLTLPSPWSWISTGFFGLVGFFAVWMVLKLTRGSRERAETYLILFNTAHDGIMTIREDIVIDCNPRALSMLGCGRDELIGQSPYKFLPANQPGGQGSADLALEAIESALGGKPQVHELQLLRLDGSPFDAELSLNRVQLKGEMHLQAFVRDITARKEAERAHELLQSELRQAQKLKAIGTLAGGIAHDFNNLLHVVRGHADLLLADVGDRGPGSKQAKVIAQAADRGADLTRQLLAFSRKVESNRIPLDLNQMLEDLEKLLGRTIPKMIAIELYPQPQLDRIEADPGQLEQVLVNLALNARDAMPEGGTLTISTSSATREQMLQAGVSPSDPGQHVELAVSDTGHGMDQETQERLFEPFFTTKDTDQGTGLGLAMVYGIVKNHRGCIAVESSPDMGSRFRLFFPALADSEQHDGRPSRSAPDSQSDLAGDETILLVEDEQVTLDMSLAILSKLGYQVLTAQNGEEALKIQSEQGRKIDLVLLDQIMPGMGGRKCLVQLLERNPDLPILILSGFTGAPSLDDLIALGARGVLNKPVGADNLLLEIRRILDHTKDVQG